MKTSEVQPAKVSYFFGPGWKDLAKFFKTFWKLNSDDIRVRQDKFETGKGIMTFKGAGALISCLFMILFGTASFVLISITISVVLGTVFLIIYFAIFLVWLVDRISLIRHHIFVGCPNCKEKYLIPTYICPTCGAKHTKLVPGKYGLIYRICECGTRIPTHFITKRGDLDAECPKCGYILKGAESVPLYVPIVGGRSAGKTAFITAFSYEFIENVAKRNHLSVSHYNPETEEFYKNEITADFLNGTTRMTQTEMNISQASSKAFSFFVESEKLKPKRLVQIYDVAGESFVENSENEIQLQYRYCQGIVFILDPLSIPVVRNALDETIDEKDKNSVGTLDSDIVLDSFMNKIREITGRSATDTISTPIAVVISKLDIKTVAQYIGEEKILEVMDSKQLGIDEYGNINDAICRKFLRDNGLSNFVSNIEMKFKNNRFFSCSAIGHVRENGKYNPKGVLEPMEWIFSLADSGMRSVWAEHQFGTNIEL